MSINAFLYVFINWKREIINKKGLKELNKEMEVTGIKLMALELVVSDCHKGIQDNHDPLLHFAEIPTPVSDAFDQMLEIFPNFFHPARNRRYTDVYRKVSQYRHLN